MDNLQKSDDKPLSYLAIFLLFLRYGFLAWGGPVAQIAMLKEDLVDKRKWVSPDKFKRVLAVYQALPGPEAHELCVYFGMIQKGRWGGFLAGLGFMLPGFALILILSWVYIHWGASALLPYCAGFAPAVTALIFRALYKMGSHIQEHRSLQIAAGVAFVLTVVGVSFWFVFILCAVWQSLMATNKKPIAFMTLIVGGIVCVCSAYSYSNVSREIGVDSASYGLFVEGLRAGLLSFGGAYTAIPFLKESMVGTYPMITTTSFLDGIALSVIIPAPLIIFGTYLGFLAYGFTGAVLITLGIFIPAFAFTLLGHSVLEKIIDYKPFHGFLDGISAAVIGLLAVTAIEIGIQTLTTPAALLLFGAAFAALMLLKQKWAIPLIILVSGFIGFILN